MIIKTWYELHVTYPGGLIMSAHTTTFEEMLKRIEKMHLGGSVWEVRQTTETDITQKIKDALTLIEHGG